MSLKKLIILCIAIFFGGIVTAQQTSQSTLYMLNPYDYNVAYAGFDRSLSTTLSYRSQWTPIDKHPKKVHINAHLPIYALNGGVGIQIESETNGVEKRNELGFSYNFVYQLNAGYISAGAGISVLQKSLDGRSIRTSDGIYENGIDHQDPILTNQQISSFSPKADIAILYNSKVLQAGLQISNIIPIDANFDEFQYTYGREFIFIGAYNLEFNQDLSLKPSLLFRYNGQFVQTNIGTLIEYGSIFGGMNVRGITPNSFESIGILSGIRFGNHYTLAYSYDLVLNTLRKSTDGSHEIVFKYNLNKLINTGLPPKVIHNPRDL